MEGFMPTNKKDYYDIMAMDLPPTMAGHFWVVRDGQVVDPKFEAHKYIQKANKLTERPCHLPAPIMCQQVMLSSHIKKAKQVFGENYAAEFERIFEGRPRMGMCFFNAVMEQHRNGGEIVFGSMGWERKSGGKFYEYGGEEFQTYADFTGKTNVFEKAVATELRRRK